MASKLYNSESLDKVIIDYLSCDGNTYQKFADEFDDIDKVFINTKYSTISLRDADQDGLLFRLFGKDKESTQKCRDIEEIVNSTLVERANLYPTALKVYVLRTGLNYICSELNKKGYSEDLITDSIKDFISNGDVEALPDCEKIRVVANNIGSNNIKSLISVTRLYDEDGNKIENATVKTYYKTAINESKKDN